ncbi:hypothetical protein FRB95_007799 [Tulasnella sp. JGI-2019a]|nr:hypothetical protein FRB95_007799 [Tulasnella sp. JGI-2019a]
MAYLYPWYHQKATNKFKKFATRGLDRPRLFDLELLPPSERADIVHARVAFYVFAWNVQGQWPWCLLVERGVFDSTVVALRLHPCGNTLKRSCGSRFTGCNASAST